MERQGLYREAVLRGAWRVAAEHGWRVRGSDPRYTTLAHIRAWRTEGILTTLWGDEFVGNILSLGLPLVDVYDWVDVPGVHRVGIDDCAVGKMAGDFLLSRRLRSFAFVGELTYTFARQRFEGFRSTLEAGGYGCQGYHGAVHMSSWNLSDGSTLTEGPLAEFLRGLDRPAGLLAVNDDVALQVLDAAKVSGLRIPDDIAILGVDDDALLCSLATPPISSIATDPHRVGVQASHVLHRLMTGVACPAITLLPPIGVIERQSTDMLAVEDPDVAAAIRWLRDNVGRPIKVQDVLRHVPLSRRSLEIKFARHIGRSPHEELTRLRVERAKTLLAQTDLPIGTVALRSGFQHAGRLATVFQEITGLTPTAYRREFLSGGNA
jgi:LacI family transcriptional regulator